MTRRIPTRRSNVYAQDSYTVANAVREWCLQKYNGVPHGEYLRLCLAGYEGEHNELEKHGWNKFAWKTGAGYAYGNKSNQNRFKERLWFSPACLSGDADTLLSHIAFDKPSIAAPCNLQRVKARPYRKDRGLVFRRTRINLQSSIVRTKQFDDARKARCISIFPVLYLLGKRIKSRTQMAFSMMLNAISLHQPLNVRNRQSR